MLIGYNYPESISNAMTKAHISRNEFLCMSDSYHDQHKPFINSLFNIPESSSLQELASCTMEDRQTHLASTHRTTGFMHYGRRTTHPASIHKTTSFMRYGRRTSTSGLDLQNYWRYAVNHENRRMKCNRNHAMSEHTITI